MEDATNYNVMQETENMLLKKAQLERRDEDRIESIQQRKNDDTERRSKQEKYDFFETNFKEECNILVGKLNDDSLKTADKLTIAKHCEELSQSFEKIIKFLNDSASFLRSYQLEQAQKTLGQIQLDITERRRELLPKKKFAFKSSKKQAGPAKEQKNPPPSTREPLKFSSNDCGISDKTDEVVVLPAEQINQRDISLSKIKNSRIELPGYPGTVHLSDVSNSTILCGPASGSVFVDNCTDSKVITGCQQLRVHNTTNTDFYLHVTSRAIIEDTKQVRFAPYNWTYENLDEHFEKSGLNKESNNWQQVDDFNWLAMEAASPNWSVLPEEDRVGKW